MNDRIKHLRFAIFTLVGLAIFSTVLLYERQSLERDLSALERIAVTAHLARLKHGGSRPWPEGTDYDGPTEQLDDSLHVYLADQNKAELAAFGRWQLELPWEHNLQTPMLGGGTLYFRVLNRIQDLAAEAPKPGEGMSVNDPLPVCSAFATLPGETPPVFITEIQIDKASRLIGGPFTFAVTNLKSTYLPAGQEYCADEGPIRVFLDVKAHKWGIGSMPPVDLDAKAAELARDWGIKAADPTDAYLTLRRQFEMDRVKLPIVNTEVNNKIALISLAAIATGLAAWVSFLFRGLVMGRVEDISVPWILVSPFSEWPKTGGLARLPALVEISLFLFFYASGLLVPVYLGYLAVESAQSFDAPVRALAYALFGLCVLLSTSASVSAGTMVARMLPIPRR